MGAEIFGAIFWHVMKLFLQLCDLFFEMTQIERNTSTPSTAELKADFELLVRQYDHVVRKVCYFYAVDTDDFNDLRQEALVNLWRGFQHFRGDAKISTWVYRVSLNSCVSFFRKHKKGKQTEAIDRHPELVDESDDKGAMLAEMYRMINRLNREDKAIILLWLDEHPYEEMAEIMGLPRNTVASRLKRAKDKLLQLKE